MVRCAIGLAAITLVLAAPALAQISQEGGPIQVNSDNSLVREKQREVTVSGNVDIVQGDARLRANTVTLNYTGSDGATRSTGLTGGFGDISSMRADGDVFYVTPELKVRGDTGVYLASTDTITLTGNVILSRGEDVARGCEMEMRVSEGRSQLKGCDGRVQMVIFPSEQDNADDETAEES
ncbi:MAG: LptA/OstA family protein [Pseudomonadota bacterium]